MQRLTVTIVFILILMGCTSTSDKILFSFGCSGNSDIFELKHNIKAKEISEVNHPENCLLDDKNILFSREFAKQLYGCEVEVYFFYENSGTTENLTKEISGVANYVDWVKGREFTHAFSRMHINDEDLILPDEPEHKA